MRKNSHFSGQPLYGQVIKLLDKSKILQFSRENGGERYTKRFNCWIHLVVMLYAVIMRFDSLREITTSLLAETRKLAHLGINFKIGRSTLADANKRRPEAIFESIYRDLYATYRNVLSSDSRNGKTPNRMYPSLSITTLFHGNEFRNTSYNLPQNLLDKYDSGALTLHELVNELFEPWKQVDESQHSLLAVALQTAAGGIPTPHVGTGAGGASSDMPWNDNDKEKYQRPKFKGRR